MPGLSNSFLHFDFDPNTARWGLRTLNTEFPLLNGVRCGVRLRDSGGRLKWDGRVRDVQLKESFQFDSAHGPLRTLTASLTPSLDSARCHFQLVLEFALPESQPFLLWRMQLENVGHQPFTLHDLNLAVIGSRFGSLIPNPSCLHLHPGAQHLAFFSNGYQSWSFTGALKAGMRSPLTRLRVLDGPKMFNLRNPMVDSLGHFTSDMFAAINDWAHNTGLVVGFLSQHEQFGHIETLLIDAGAPYLRLTAHGDGVPVLPGAERITDWAYVQFMQPQAEDPLGVYLDAAARENNARVPLRTPVGWCSWYHYYDRVTETDIVNNLSAMTRARERLPLDFVQVDDGFQAQVGDWFEAKPTFPRGLRWLAQQIRAHGHTPGLWLAPYIVRSDARLSEAQPEWFLCDERGDRVSAGFNWVRWCYALDPTHPGVREHTHQLIETAVNDWGFPYLKLDFLYAAALEGQRYDPSLTRAQAMRLALQDIRDAAGPETFLLGCGCPLGPAIGLVDGMRISTDVAPNWHPEFFSPMLNRWLETELGFVSARNAVQNIISRAPLHRRWWLNDPDCLLVRDEATKLTEAEVRCLATVIALSGGMFLVSDDMSRLNPERYRYIEALMPVLNVSARARDWLRDGTPNTLTMKMKNATGEWLLAGLFNWDDVPRARKLELADLGLEPGAYWVADFWGGAVHRLGSDVPLDSVSIPPHGAHLLALRRVTAGPALIASSFHFSQGGEVTQWSANGDMLRFTIELGRTAEGWVTLALPAAPYSITTEGQTLKATETGDGEYTLALTVRGSARVVVNGR
ncbi:MAG: alpha-galactosidase [Anaerolineales bacterium]